MLKRSIFSIFSVIIVLFTSSISAFAAQPVVTKPTKLSNENVQATITITNPKTGKKWSSTVDPSDIKISPSTSNSLLSTLTLGEPVGSAEVSINASDYLSEADPGFVAQAAALSAPSLSTMSVTDTQTKTDDITIKAGLTYTINGQKVALNSAFGSTTDKGMYYAANRSFWWNNPFANDKGTKTPTSSSWSYATAGTYGPYTNSAPPYVKTETRVYVTGMTSYRTISVTLNLAL